MIAHPSIQASASNWRKTLYILFFAQLVTAAGFSSMFPFLPLYIEELGSTTQLSVELLAGLVYSGQAFAMMLASPIWGAIADRYGRKLMVERSMFGGAVILLMMAFVRSAEELVLLRTIQGLITGSMAAVNALVAAVAPRRHTGFAMGVLQVGTGAGVALGPLIGGVVADAFGYHAAFYVTASLLFVSGFMVLFGVEENFSPEEREVSNNVSFWGEWRHVLTTPGVTTAFGLRFMSQLGRMMIIPIAPFFIKELLTNTSGLNTFTGLVIGSASVTTTLSAVFLGRLGDRIGQRRIVIASALSATLLYAVQSLVTAGWQLLVLQALVGVALGGIIPAISALLANITTTGEAGAVYGLDNSITAGSRTVAPLIGSMVAAWFSLRATFTATALLFLITGVLAIYQLPRVMDAKETHQTL